MSASGAMPQLMGMRSADMRRAEMPPATAATHATNRDLTTPPDAKGETHGPGGEGVSAGVPLGAAATSGSSRYTQARADPEGPHASGRTARAAASLSRPWPAHRPGRARAGPLSTGRFFRRHPSSCPTSTSTASDGIPCHGADGPREDRFQGRSAPTRKTRP
jgi:hypothetical protein